jgi:hypothetical protein
MAKWAFFPYFMLIECRGFAYSSSSLFAPHVRYYDSGWSVISIISLSRSRRFDSAARAYREQLVGVRQERLRKQIAPFAHLGEPRL